MLTGCDQDQGGAPKQNVLRILRTNPDRFGGLQAGTNEAISVETRQVVAVAFRAGLGCLSYNTVLLCLAKILAASWH